MKLNYKKLAIKKKTVTKRKAAPKRKAATAPKKKVAAKRKAAPKRKAASKKKATPSKTKKVAFGGYAISFAGRTESVELVFGKKPIPPSEMIKKIWAFVKSKSLANR